jgi:hypothetical protein
LRHYTAVAVQAAICQSALFLRDYQKTGRRGEKLGQCELAFPTTEACEVTKKLGLTPLAPKPEFNSTYTMLRSVTEAVRAARNLENCPSPCSISREIKQRVLESEYSLFCYWAGALIAHNWLLSLRNLD